MNESDRHQSDGRVGVQRAPRWLTALFALGSLATGTVEWPVMGRVTVSMEGSAVPVSRWMDLPYAKHRRSVIEQEISSTSLQAWAMASGKSAALGLRESD